MVLPLVASGPLREPLPAGDPRSCWAGGRGRRRLAAATAGGGPSGALGAAWGVGLTARRRLSTVHLGGVGQSPDASALQGRLSRGWRSVGARGIRRGRQGGPEAAPGLPASTQLGTQRPHAGSAALGGPDSGPVATALGGLLPGGGRQSHRPRGCSPQQPGFPTRPPEAAAAPMPAPSAVAPATTPPAQAARPQMAPARWRPRPPRSAAALGPSRARTGVQLGRPPRQTSAASPALWPCSPAQQSRAGGRGGTGRVGGPGHPPPRPHMMAQKRDWPVSRGRSLARSRTRMAWFPYCEYHRLRLRLR